MTMQPEPPAPVTPPNEQALYGWIIVGITFLATALVIGSRFSLGLFLTNLPEAFDTSTAAVSGALAISMLGAAALQPVTGYLLDAWGGRIVIAIGLGAGGIALCGTAVADSLWQLVAFMGLLGSVAYAAVSPVSATSIVASWFERRRGVALGIATSGTKVAMVTLPPLLMLLITLQGWRSAMLALGLTLCLLVPLVLLLLRPAPGHIRTTRRPKQAAEGAPTPPPGMSYRDALR